MGISNIASIIIWVIVGLVILCGDGDIGKLEYGCCWVCLMINLIINALGGIED
jgi:hypothetical protein